MPSKMVRPAGLEPATPGLGNRFNPFAIWRILGNIEEIHSETIHETPLESADNRRNLTSFLTSRFHRYMVRRIVRRRLDQIRKTYGSIGAPSTHGDD